MAESDPLTAPVMLPTWVGVNVTMKEHWLCAARVDPQVLFTIAKSPLLVNWMFVKVVLRLLIRVTGCGALVVPTFWVPNVIFVGEKTTGSTPVPLTPSTCCPTFELSEITIAPLMVLKNVGVNITLNLQVPFAAKTVPS